MLKVLTAAQMRELDRITIEECGVPGPVLMQNAGAAVVRLLERNYPERVHGPVLVLCGKGNNGGDGFVVARLLRSRGAEIRVVLLADPASIRGDAEIAFEGLRATIGGAIGVLHTVSTLDEWLQLKPELLACTVVVDAIFGTGLTSLPSGFLREIILDINDTFAAVPLVAVDMPSGLPADGQLDTEGGGESPAIVKANWTVTFSAPKLGQLLPAGEAFVGNLCVEPIGTPASVLQRDEFSVHLLTPADLSPLVAPRRADAHKGNFGHVLVIGGSLGKSGAVAMASEAALRCGAGLVTAAVPRSVLALAASYRPEIMTEPLAETEQGTVSTHAFDYGAIDRLLAGKTVVALGPGLSTHPETVDFARRLLGNVTVPIVVDADGLNAFAGAVDRIRSARAGAVLTPHPGEAARLLAGDTTSLQKRRIASAHELAERSGAVVVLKGHRTVTASPRGAVYLNTTGNPGMATGGSGDVLTGIVAGLLAQFSGLDHAFIAAAAVYLHGLAGDLAAQRNGEMSLAATDITAALPAAIMALRHPAVQDSFELPAQNFSAIGNVQLSK